jgi:hypothetical protein
MVADCGEKRGHEHQQRHTPRPSPTQLKGGGALPAFLLLFNAARSLAGQRDST